MNKSKLYSVYRNRYQGCFQEYFLFKNKFFLIGKILILKGSEVFYHNVGTCETVLIKLSTLVLKMFIIYIKLKLLTGLYSGSRNLFIYFFYLY